MSNSYNLGNDAEMLAKQFLQEKGLSFLYHQYRTKRGEIDLIMQEKQTLVFVEVRFRQNTQFGYPQETVTWHKQQHLIKAACYFQQCHPWSKHYMLRFDVVAILGGKLNPEITWIPNAFGVQ